MIENYIQGRTSVFIDASNIYHSQKSLNFRVDFRKLYEYFSSRLKLIDIYFYTAKMEGDRKQRNFLRLLKSSGYSVRKKKVKFIFDRTNKKVILKGNLDVELVIDSIDTMDRFNNYVLLSGDSDFAELLRYLKKNKKQVIVMSSKKHIAKELLDEAKYIDLKKLKNRLEFTA